MNVTDWYTVGWAMPTLRYTKGFGDSKQLISVPLILGYSALLKSCTFVSQLLNPPDRGTAIAGNKTRPTYRLIFEFKR
ncbi:hypothetical protein [Coleofasciculus sp. F4-SAH-05]|uniref:hypothetical protein n=1 Tax=Coleofasciculus TaxID=669368 RepID=UPI0032F58D2B